MPDNRKKPDSINPVLVAASGFAGAIMFGWLFPAVLVRVGSNLTFDHYLSELLEGSITVASGLFLSVVVAMLVENHRLRSARAAADRELRRAVVAQLRDVHDQVKAAALLINAHKSARTYGEQMRRLIEVRVRLLDARRTIIGETSRFADDVAQLRESIDSSANYLQHLIDEYEEHYLRVSMIQSYSHEWNQAQARSAAQSKDPPLPEQMKSSPVPWAELTGPDFKRLRALREDDKPVNLHEVEFSKPLGAAIDLLRMKD